MYGVEGGVGSRGLSGAVRARSAKICLMHSLNSGGLRGLLSRLQERPGQREKETMQQQRRLPTPRPARTLKLHSCHNIFWLREPAPPRPPRSGPSVSLKTARGSDNRSSGRSPLTPGFLRSGARYPLPHTPHHHQTLEPHKGRKRPAGADPLNHLSFSSAAIYARFVPEETIKTTRSSKCICRGGTPLAG